MESLTVTTSNDKAFALRLTPSNRVFRLIRTHKFGEPKERAIVTADCVAEKLEKAARRGRFTKLEMKFSILPWAAFMAQQEPLKRIEGKTIYTREVNS